MKLFGPSTFLYALTTTYIWPRVAGVNYTIDDKLGDSVTGPLPVDLAAATLWNDQITQDNTPLTSSSLPLPTTTTTPQFSTATTPHQFTTKEITSKLPMTITSPQLPKTTTSQRSSAMSTVFLQSTTATSGNARVPVGAIAGGVTGGIATISLVIFLLFRRQGYDAHRRDMGHGGPVSQRTNFNGGTSHPTISHNPLLVHSTTSIVSTPQLANQSGGNDSSYSVRGAGPSQQYTRPKLLANPKATHGDQRVPRPQPSHPNARKNTRGEIRRVRQGELDNRLRVVQQGMQELQRLAAGAGGTSASRRQQTSGEVGAAGGEADLSSVSDMREEIRLMREQIQILREQQESAWAQGLSDDLPPGYTPIETSTQHSREPSS